MTADDRLEPDAFHVKRSKQERWLDRLDSAVIAAKVKRAAEAQTPGAIPRLWWQTYGVPLLSIGGSCLAGSSAVQLDCQDA